MSGDLPHLQLVRLVKVRHVQLQRESAIKESVFGNISRGKMERTAPSNFLSSASTMTRGGLLSISVLILELDISTWTMVAALPIDLQVTVTFFLDWEHAAQVGAHVYYRTLCDVTNPVRVSSRYHYSTLTMGFKMKL